MACNKFTNGARDDSLAHIDLRLQKLLQTKSISIPFQGLGTLRCSSHQDTETSNELNSPGLRITLSRRALREEYSKLCEFLDNKTLRTVLRQLDEENTGYIHCDELLACLNALEFKIEAQVLDALLLLSGTDSQQINHLKFCRILDEMCQPERITPEEGHKCVTDDPELLSIQEIVNAAFNRSRRNGLDPESVLAELEGSATKQEFQRMLKDLGVTLTVQQLVHLIKTFLNSDGFVDIDSFSMFVFPKQQLTSHPEATVLESVHKKASERIQELENELATLRKELALSKAKQSVPNKKGSRKPDHWIELIRERVRAESATVHFDETMTEMEKAHIAFEHLLEQDMEAKDTEVNRLSTAYHAERRRANREQSRAFALEDMIIKYVQNTNECIPQMEESDSKLVRSMYPLVVSELTMPNRSMTVEALANLLQIPLNSEDLKRVERISSRRILTAGNQEQQMIADVFTLRDIIHGFRSRDILGLVNASQDPNLTLDVPVVIQEMIKAFQKTNFVWTGEANELQSLEDINRRFREHSMPLFDKEDDLLGIFGWLDEHAEGSTRFSESWTKYQKVDPAALYRCFEELADRQIY